MGPLALALLISLQRPAASTSLSAPQSTQSPAAAQPSQDTGLKPDDLPVSVGRIQRALEAPPAITLKEQHPAFRLEVFGRKPTLEEILGDKFWLGPAPYGGMTHQEFLNMVTPKDVQGYAAFSNAQGMVVAATSIGLQWALQKALDKFKDAKNERAKEAAQKEVQDALDALRKARREAGLPDK